MLVLCVLARGPLHGYAINAAVGELTGQRLGRGSLSSALTRLEGKQLIEPLPARGRQRPLRLTSGGRQLLEQELEFTARITQRMFETAVPDRAHYQERLAATDTARAYKNVMRRALAARPGQTVLDLGCGPGGDLKSLAEAVTSAGLALGVDHDPHMVKRARSRLSGHSRVSVLQADVHALPVADARVDLAWTESSDASSPGAPNKPGSTSAKSFPSPRYCGTRAKPTRSWASSATPSEP
uniref:Methyltransferase domain-containing protein n=1 Tax=Streptomyces sp. NBC_00003 TaxID=2903608 RepID=A0AAU2UYK6_9ACTN